jgi:hypothetical protein
MIVAALADRLSRRTTFNITSRNFMATYFCFVVPGMKMGQTCPNIAGRSGIELFDELHWLDAPEEMFDFARTWPSVLFCPGKAFHGVTMYV